MQVTVRYVHPHPKTKKLQYRRRVPKHLVEAMGCREVVRPLRSQDPLEAARHAEAINKQVEREFALLTEAPTDTPLQVHARTLKWLAKMGYAVGPAPTDEEAEVRDAHADVILTEHERRLRREPEPEDLSPDDLARVNALRGGVERPTITIRDALRVYMEERGDAGRNPAEQRRFRLERERCVNMLVEVIGDKPVPDVTRADARAYRDVLSERLKSIASVNKYLRNLRAIFELAIRELELSKANPFDRLQLQDPEAAKDKRDSFTPEELAQVVKASEGGALRDDLKCILHMLTDTGARLGEIVGLERADVVLDAPVPHILIRPNDTRGLKTNNSKRRVPLVGIAAEAAKAALEAAPDTGPIFPAYSGDRGNTTASASLNKFLRTRAKITDRKLTIHSLRHTFKDRMRNVGISEDVRDYLQGHANGKVSADYGEGASLDYLLEQLRKVAPVGRG